jgi:hypothetical protein
MTITWGIVPLRATMHRAPDDGNFSHAKSRAGSHISVMVFGRYPPIELVSCFVTSCDRLFRLCLYKLSQIVPRCHREERLTPHRSSSCSPRRLRIPLPSLGRPCCLWIHLDSLGLWCCYWTSFRLAAQVEKCVQYHERMRPRAGST